MDYSRLLALMEAARTVRALEESADRTAALTALRKLIRAELDLVLTQ